LEVTSGAELMRTESLGRWFSAASNEVDPFKRFMWAYAGLEVLASKAESLFRDDIIAQISSAPAQGLTAMSARQLLYPVPSDDAKDPWRSIVFKFAALTVALGGESTDRDLEQFVRINKFRNRIHGQRIDEDLAETEASIAVDLLRKYGPKIAKRL